MVPVRYVANVLEIDGKSPFGQGSKGPGALSGISGTVSLVQPGSGGTLIVGGTLTNAGTGLATAALSIAGQQPGSVLQLFR